MQANDGGSRVRGAWMGVVVVLVWASGCTPSAAGPDPAPSPVVRTPSAAPSTPSREEQYGAEAIEAYRKARAAWDEVARAGGSAEAPASFDATMSGVYLEAFTEISRALYDEGIRQVGEASEPRVDVTGVKVSNTVSDGPPTVDLTACEDGTGLSLLDQNGQEAERDVPQRLFVQSLVAKPDRDGVWKIDDGSSKPVDDFEGEGVCDEG